MRSGVFKDEIGEMLQFILQFFPLVCTQKQVCDPLFHRTAEEADHEGKVGVILEAILLCWSRKRQ